MLAIIDYGVGNLFSLKCSLGLIGEQTEVTSNPDVIKNADRLILPGVGAFGDAADKLRESGLFRLVKEQAKSGKPMLGICLGMQMLFNKSYEYGEHSGLSLISGNIKPIRDVVPKSATVPHMGWNALDIQKESPLFKYINNGDHVYFVHSYYGTDCEDVIATSEYYAPLTAAVQKDNIYGTQFHPEKSGEVGLKILKAFCEIK